LAAVLPVSLPTGNDRAYLGRGLPTATPTAVTSAHYGPFRVAVNLGVRIQDEGRAFAIRDGTALRTGVAGSFNPSILGGNWKTPWAPEGYWFDAALTHETPLTAPFQHADNERLEAALALNWSLGEGFIGTVGSGFGLWPGFGVPAVRPMLTVRYAPAPTVAAGRHNPGK